MIIPQLQNSIQPNRQTHPIQLTNRQILILHSICKYQRFPKFFIDDFIKYKNKNGWKINGALIKKVPAVFVKWSKARKKRLKEEGLWHGVKIENWDLTPAVFKGFYKPANPNNTDYIELLSKKLLNGEAMTKQEKKDIKQMKMKEALEDEIYNRQKFCGSSPYFEQHEEKIDELRETYEQEDEYETDNESEDEINSNTNEDLPF